MKLLGWMHRKFRQNSGDIFKDFASGPSCNCFCARPSLEEHRHNSYRLPAGSRGLFSEAEFVDAGEEAVLFEGLLTIGTLGSRPVEMNEEVVEDDGTLDSGVPETVQSIAEKQAEAATEAELMVVGAELEKVLAVEAEKGGDRLSSARASHAGGKGAAACPLQEYLFGSAVEAAETAERRERRASLGELFMMSRVAAEEEGGGKVEEAAGRGGEEARSTVGMHLMMMKKMVRPRGPSCASSSSGGGTRVTPAVATKFHKILKIFRRKIHPENSMVQKKHRKPTDTITPRDEGNGSGGSCASDDMLLASGSTSTNEGISLGGRSDSSVSREHWIKTDSDYLVLEL